tara:strand:- start:575 stop:1654 length:1080 start_codon:yes stop_codon:yes gene_type:complete
MHFINKIKNFKNIYLVIITTLLFLNTIFILELHAVSFKVSKVEISEEFNLNFSKKKVFDTAFSKAFDQLTSMIVTSKDKNKLKNVKLSTIKNLVDSFNVSDEEFIDDKYFATFSINFNKKNTLKFFERKNIFASIPKKLDILFIPVLIDLDEEKLIIFTNNPIYNNWNNNQKKYDLLNYILPNEDIEDRDTLSKNLKNIEDYDFEEIIQKYDLDDFIVNIVFKNKNELKILSKVQLNNNYKIINTTYDKVNLDNKESVFKLVNNLKIIYEDNWKGINKINTSIKLPLTVYLSSNNHHKIQSFENTMNNLDLVSDFYILSFDNKNIFYKIIYNGSPDKFLREVKENGLQIIKDDKNWYVE